METTRSLDKRFLAHIRAEFPEFFGGRRFLLAFSGGMDSVVLGDLLRRAGVPFDAAHCNFHLRGEESLRDERFACRQADAWGVKCFRVGFQTEAYARNKGLSIEMAARELRYGWFSRLVRQGDYGGIVTAHHGDDQVETVLLTWVRGGALEGLCGMKPRNGLVLRPLLPFSRQEIAAFAQERELRWVDDSSNASLDYTRNRLRLTVIPLLKQINPSLVHSVGKNTAYLQGTADLYAGLLDERLQSLVSPTPWGVRIDMRGLKELGRGAQAALYRLLRPYGLDSRVDDVMDCVLRGNSGALFENGDFRLLREREALVLERKREQGEVSLRIPFGTERIEQPVAMSFRLLEDFRAAEGFDVSGRTVFFDADRLTFPLVLRAPRAGDVFCPLGMGGRRKKVSKLLKDEKVSVFDKQRTRLLCAADGRVAWVVGLRVAQDFRVTQDTRRVLVVRLLE